MNRALKYVLFILVGAAVALLLVGLYSWFFNPLATYGDPEELPPVKVSDKDVFIAGISGEVFIIRDGDMLSAEIGDELLEGDVLKVVDQSYCQVQFSDRGTAGLDSNTVMLMKKLVNAQKDLQIRTEVLMGSMFYRVKRLSDYDQFQVESDGVIYDVKGTEFLIVRTDDGTLLAVSEGAVEYSSGDIVFDDPLVGAGEEIHLTREERESAQPAPMGESARRRMETLEGLNQVDVNEELPPVTIALETDPPGAEIYLGGRKIAVSWFSGLFNRGEKLDFLVRKRGYQNKNLHVEASSEGDKIFLVSLDPASVESTLEEGVPTESFDQLIDKLEDKHSLELSEQQKNFETRLDEREKELDELESRSQSMEMEITEKEKEIDDLKDLILQIQTLTNQE